MKLQKLYHLITLGSVLALTTVGCRHPAYVTPIGYGRPGTATIPTDGGPITNPNPTFVSAPPTDAGRPTRSPQPPSNQDINPGTPVKTGVGTGDSTLTSAPQLPTGIAPVDPTTLDHYIPNTEILRLDTIYFDYDKSAVKASEESKLNEVAAYWKANPTNGIRVEGNCDERGTDEYNRSLGDRRAMAAREYLVGLGVDPKMILTVSYGKDKPADTGHDEAAYAKNRRDEFVVLVPPSKP